MPRHGPGLAKGERGRRMAGKRCPQARKRSPMTAAPIVPAVSLRNVAVTFGQKGSGYTAVQGIDLVARPGEFIAIVGPTGCGKSTLLNASAGLLRPAEGQVEIFGAPLQGLNGRAGYLFQQDALMPWKTALQ